MASLPAGIRFRRWLVAAAAALLISAAGADHGKNHYILDCDPDCGPVSIAGATATAIGAPGAVTTDRLGNVYFSSQSIVFRLGVDGTLARVAGNGTPGFAGDGGPAVDALLSFPIPTAKQDLEGYPWLPGGLAVDTAGNLYIADGYNNRIRRVDARGDISTVAGMGAGGFAGGLPDHAADARFVWLQGVAVDADRSVYASTWSGTLTRVAADGAIAVLAWDSCHELWGNSWYCPAGQPAVGASHVVYFGDGYCRVRAIDATGHVATLVGDERSIYYRSGCGFRGEGTPAATTALTEAASVAVDGGGNVYFADTYNHCVRKLDRTGIVITIAGVCTQPGFFGDGGPASAARLTRPTGVAIDRRGNVYIADTGNNRLRKVRRDGIVTTVAGSGAALSP
jgi:trimeric autotransporter adhesin